MCRVLEEGDALTEQRKQWQEQASRSLGNSRTRSLSRARAKSLSRSHGRPGHKPDGSTTLEYLATRTLLGGQSIAPTVSVTYTSHSRSYSHSHTTSDTRTRSNSYSFSHSHSHSLGNTSSQKSVTDPHSTRHARNESWGKTALLKACAPCGDRSDLCDSPVENKAPAQQPRTEEHNEGNVVVIKGVSPVPSAQSGEGVGIAFSSPADHFRPAHRLEDSMADHPYATGAIYTRYYDPSSANENGLQHTHKVSEYAGPHPSAYEPQLRPNTAASDVSMRHRLPPRAVQPGAISHPYAAAFSEPASSHTRQPSNTIPAPPPIPPSVVQEGMDFTSNHHISISSPDFEKYGVGEALVFAAPSQDGRDSGSEDQPLGTVIPPQRGTLDRIVDIGKFRDLAPPHKRSRSSKSRPSSVTVIVSKRSPSPTVTEGWDSAQGLPQLSPTTNISSAHLVISALDNNDDLEEFQDLFYKPPQCSSKNKEASDTHRSIPSDIHTSSSGSALTNLLRSLNEEIGELDVAASETSLGQRSTGPSAPRSNEISQSYVFRNMSRTPSSASAKPPSVHRLPSQHYDAPFELGIPEDIASSRASSLLMTEENDTFGMAPPLSWLQSVFNTSFEGHPIRQGLVDSATSTILHCPSRAASTHPEIQDDAEAADAISPISYIDSQLRSPGGVRLSYMTGASEYSRMSALSDFPVPPARPDFAPARTSILQISANAPSMTQRQKPENPPETDFSFSPRSGSTLLSPDSRRTTFGGSDDVDYYTGAQV